MTPSPQPQPSRPRQAFPNREPDPAPAPRTAIAPSISTSTGRRSLATICSSIASTIAKAPPSHLYQAAASTFFNYSIVNPHTFFATDAVSFGNALKRLLLSPLPPVTDLPIPPTLSSLALTWVRGYNAYRLGHTLPENILFTSLIRIAASHLVTERLAYYATSNAPIPGTQIRPANADPNLDLASIPTSIPHS